MLGWAHGGPEVLKTTGKTPFTTERRKKSQTTPNPQIYQYCQIAEGRDGSPMRSAAFPWPRHCPGPLQGLPGGCSSSEGPGRSRPGPAAPGAAPGSQPGCPRVARGAPSPAQSLTCGSRCRSSQRRSRAGRTAMPGPPHRRCFVPTWPGPDPSAPGTQSPPRTSRPVTPSRQRAPPGRDVTSGSAG